MWFKFFKKKKFKIGDIIYNKKQYLGELIIVEIFPKYYKAIIVSGKYDRKYLKIKRTRNYVLCGNILRRKNED